ncbi:MAG: ATP-dependent DNA helicase RecG, partial [bacterium]
AERRLAVLSSTLDGFKIAEEDLAIRGPGDFFGTQQSGLPDLRVADLLRDRGLVELTRKESDMLLAENPYLDEYPKLRRRVNRMWKSRLEYFETY